MTKEKAQKYLDDNFSIIHDKEDILYAMIGFAKEIKEGFIAGAKCQQKKMFTEEQLAMAMLDFGLYIAENRGKPIDTDNKIKEIIEQFKQQEQ